MKTLHLLLLLLCGFSFLTAQDKSSLEEKKVKWLGETNLEYVLEKKKKASFEHSVDRLGLNPTSSYVYHLKVNPSAACGRSINQYFTQSLLDLIVNGKIDVYALDGHKKLRKEEAKDKMSRKDTVVTFDPASFEEAIRVISYENYDGIQSFKVKQHWFIPKGEDRLSVKVVGLIPMYTPDKHTAAQELFYIPMEGAAMEYFDFDQPGFVWIKNSIDYLPLSSFKTLKGDIKALEELIWNKPEQGKITLYDWSSDYFCPEVLAEDYFKKALTEKVDTVITFPLDPYEEKIRIVKMPALTYELVVGLRTDQMWVYDAEAQCLNAYLKGVGPIIEWELATYPVYRSLYSLKFD